MSYDPHCYHLAERFMEDFVFESVEERKAHCDRLAQRIQVTIEDYIDDMQLKEKP